MNPKNIKGAGPTGLAVWDDIATKEFAQLIEPYTDQAQLQVRRALCRSSITSSTRLVRGAHKLIGSGYTQVDLDRELVVNKRILIDRAEEKIQNSRKS